MSQGKQTPVSALGQFALIDRLTAPFTPRHVSTVRGPGDDAAVVDTGARFHLISTDLLLEGVQFDLTYYPLVHLGYKAVTAGISDIVAMNGTPTQVLVSVGISSRFSVEMLDQLYEGVRLACERYGVDLAGGDTSASVNGLTLSITVVGEVEKGRIAYRSGAQLHDLLCVTGDLGAAYMGLHLLEREKRALDGHPNPTPQFEGKEYILERYLRPHARLDIVRGLAELKIVPSAMIDITDGLASEVLQLCKASACGARIYLDRLPLAEQTSSMAAELNADPVVSALNGGEDYELLFTVPIALEKEIRNLGVDIIGHITAPETGAALVTPDGQEIPLQAPGWVQTE